MKIIKEDNGLDVIFIFVPDMVNNWDLMISKTPEEALKLLNEMDQSFAYLEDSNHWDHFMVPKMNFYRAPKLQRLKFNIGTSFLRFFMPKPAVKKRVDRFIFLLKDVGLYQHYTDKVFLDTLKLQIFNRSHTQHRDEVRVLKLNYFSYVFAGWLFGIGVAFILLGFEIIRERRCIFN